MIAKTPAPPYFAVIFTSIRNNDDEDYLETALQMEKLASQSPGYLGHESAREEIGITVSYWENLESIKNWKANLKHQVAQKLGKEKWYSQYKTRICIVERDYSFENM
ncbi:antibiotic biosynthesis monooxygenase family protein [Mongoliibacter ruber]|uniref:Heme-degrading monooxygenase HmoA n=1 Tax=Mongoliibacter ruber TaxID=1750599 RepID=A0A2T0WK74_9BACT|nr:antibiotic biosynthesis monooxygenase [Mongoliibacter ruber]PRY87108.1 heme-degrading monooxygenase HmoA [Mongoliibacter ruber]